MRGRWTIAFISILSGLPAVSAGADSQQSLPAWVESTFVPAMPATLQKTFHDSVDAVEAVQTVDDAADPSQKSFECVQLSKPWPWRQILTIRSSCFTEQDRSGGVLTESRLQKELFQTLVRLWMKNKSMDRNHPISEIIVRNYFFDTATSAFEPRVNIDQPFSRSLVDFWTKVGWKSLTDPNFANTSPELYSFVAEYFLENGQKYSDNPAARIARYSDGLLRYLHSNTEAWYARYRILQQAQHTIHTTYFIVEDDIFGLSFLEMLRQKALAGVKVKLMVDIRGGIYIVSRPWQNPLLAALADAGVEVRLYNSWLVSGNVEHPFVSNHDKILVVDGRDFVVGGRNISKDYFPEPEDHPRVFEDGDAVGRSESESMRLIAAFSEEFYSRPVSKIRSQLTYASRVTKQTLRDALPAMEEWMFTDHQSSPSIDQYPELKKYPRLKNYDFGDLFRGAHAVQFKVVDSNSSFAKEKRRELIDVILFSIATAKNRIWIHTPYLVLPKNLRQALVEASQRGIEIKITTNSRESSDNPYPVIIFEGEYRDLYRDMPTLELMVGKGPSRMHQKVMVVDDEVSLISSYNFDEFGEHSNSEVGVYVRSQGFNDELAQWMTDYSAKKAVKLPRPDLADDQSHRGLFYYLLNYFVRSFM